MAYGDLIIHTDGKNLSKLRYLLWNYGGHNRQEYQHTTPQTLETRVGLKEQFILKKNQIRLLSS